MIIDFKEIPQANKGGGNQDSFELFSRDFIKLLGYEIVSDPARGADCGLDFKIKELRKKQNGDQIIFWLASCKHYAHSGRQLTRVLNLIFWIELFLMGAKDSLEYIRQLPQTA